MKLYISPLKVIISLFLAVIITSSCINNNVESNSTNTTITSENSEIEALFKNNCTGCHGPSVQTFVDRNWKYGNSKDSLFKSISKGRAESSSGMPAFGSVLNKDEIDGLISYIQNGIENMDTYEFDKNVSDLDTFSTQSFDYVLERVTDGMDSPWGMAFLPQGGFLVTDKSGELWYIDENNGKAKIKGVPEVLDQGQGGLMDIELHPDFENNALIYLSYSTFKKVKDEILSSTAVSRFQLKGRELVESKLIFVAQPYSDRRHHYGSRLEFDNEGYLYISVGDRGNRDKNPQSLEFDPGKIHRLHDNGEIPADNPFMRGDLKSSIYTYGHRNQQGLVIHPESGQLWSHEHGPRGGDEINIIERGKNYGWPIISYGINYNGTVITPLTKKDGMEQPLHQWTPSIAACGMEFVRGNKYKDWKGKLLVGSLRYEYLGLCTIEDKKVVSEEILLENIGRVRSVRQAPDGFIYVGVERPGRIYKIVPLY